MKLKVSEIFYSLQGEGHRAGTANVFIRLSGCKAKHACLAYGVECDTEFESGTEYTLRGLAEKVSRFKCKNIIWTGGEPADRVTDEVADYFNHLGYYQAIETSGLFPVSDKIDYLTISPKVAEHVLEKRFKDRPVDELRYVRHAGQGIPEPSLEADYYFVSPHSNGNLINMENLQHCIELVKEYPKWRLSVQQHKIWQVL